jgi:hypothetical protein
MSTFNLKDALSPEMQAKLAQVMGAEIEETANAAEDKKPARKSDTRRSAPKAKAAAVKKPLQAQKDFKGRLEKIKVVQDWLQETWPALFNLQQPKPLKRQIEQEIIEQAGDKFSKIQIRRAIHAYTTRMAYLQAVLTAEGRYDLNGEKVEEVTPQQIEYSQKLIEVKNQRFKESQEKRKRWKLSQKAGGKAVDKVDASEPSQQKD